MDILTGYFRQMLGQAFVPSWNFSLHNLYPQTITDLSSLVHPFTQEEITNAFFLMNTYASPGPDGFGPGFYKKYWQSIKSEIFELFQQFQNQSADISSINRAYLILWPKSDSATSPDAFRPISLQNCPIKAIAKVLTNRLQTFIPAIIHLDQTDFVKGRSIAENFN
jgi:hypothetical protein